MPFDASLAPSEQRYKIGEEVGKGGQGRVYLCEDSTLGRTVALKEPKEVRGWSRLQREVLIAAKLSHPNIVPVYDITTVDGKPCSVMKLVGSQTLTDAIEDYHESLKNRELHTGLSNSTINKRPTRTLTDLLRILKDTCNAIAYAHSQKVLHRDLKPQNISLGEYGETIVLDWGLACSIDDIQNSQLSHQSGSPGYCAPEQLSGDSTKIGFPTDIYSLGAILFKILTNTTVLDAPRTTSQAGPRDTGTLSPKALQPTVPADLDAICRKALQWKPEDRYATVTDFAKDLDCFAQDLPVSVRKANWRDNLRRFSKVHYAGLLSTATAATIAAIASGVIISLVLFKDKQITAARDDMATALTVADNTLRGLEGEGMSFYTLADAATGRLNVESDDAVVGAALPLYKGLLMFKERRKEESIPLFREAVERDPQRRTALFFLSLALGSINNHEESVSLGLRLVEMQPDNVYALQHVADMFYSSAVFQDEPLKKQKLLREAEDFASRALELDNQFDLTLGTMGQIKIERGELEEAYEFIKKAVDLNPNEANKRNLIAILREQERFQEAYDVSKDLVDGKSEVPNDFLRHARILLSLRRLEEAIEYFQRFDEMQKQLPPTKQEIASHYNDWALALASQRKFAEALKVYEWGKQNLTGNPIFEANVAYALIGSGDLERGKAKMVQAFETDKSPSTFCMLLQSLMISDDFDLAAELDASVPIFDSSEGQKYVLVRAALAHIACTLTNQPPTPAARQWGELSQSPAIERETWDYYYLEQWLQKLPDTQRAEATSVVEKLSSIIAPRYPAAK